MQSVVYNCRFRVRHSLGYCNECVKFGFNDESLYTKKRFESETVCASISKDIL